MNNLDCQVWVGLIEAVPATNSPAGDPVGIFSTAAIWAYDENDCALKIREALSKEGLTMLAVEELEPLEERSRHYIIPNQLLELANNVNSSNPVLFCAFHRYPRSE